MSTSILSPEISRRPGTSALKSPSSQPIFAPKSQNQNQAYLGVATPPNPVESPERAAKRAKFEQQAQTQTQLNGYGQGSGVSLGAGAGAGLGGSSRLVPPPPPNLGQVGRSPSNGRGGAVWVNVKIKELEEVYKECILAATLLLQYKAYAKKLGISSRGTPIHLTHRLEGSWMKYQSLRSHIEAYLLQCAQSATAPAKPVPTPSALVPGLPPLPPTPTIPISAMTLLQSDPHRHRPGQQPTISLETLLAADPKKGLMGYENGQIVFPGVPSDIAVPGVNLGDGVGMGVGLEQVEVPDIILSMPMGMNGQGQAIGETPGSVINIPDLSAVPEGDIDLNSLDIAELSALINGDSLMQEIGSVGAGGGVGNGQQNLAGIMGATPNQGNGRVEGGVSPNTQAETDRLFETLGQLAQNSTQQDLSPFGNSTSRQSGQRASPRLMEATRTMENMLASLNQAQQTQPIPQISQLQQNPRPVPVPQQQARPTAQSQQPRQPQQPYSPPQPPQQQAPTSQNFNFDFPGLDTVGTMDGLDTLADINFDELLFDNSGRTSRAPSPVGGIAGVSSHQQQQQQQQPTQGITGQAQPTLNVIAQPVSNSRAPPLFAALEPLPTNGPAQRYPQAQAQAGLNLNLYPTNNNDNYDKQHQQPTMTMQPTDSAFDGSLGGIDLDDFNFGDGDGDGDGDGRMPGVDGDEFERMFADFK